MCLSKVGCSAPAAAAAAAATPNSRRSSNSPDMDKTSEYTPRSSPPSNNRSPNSGAPQQSHPPQALSPGSRAPPHPPPVASVAAAASPPPTLVPSSGLSMVSMASMLGHHPPPFLMSPGGPLGYHGRDFGRDDFAANMHKFMDRSFGGDSPPPPTVPTNDPTANECKIVDYRGEKIAAFVIGGKTMLCLPQAFELFLKHLVGGLHTVYTKLKRLEITPIVCNVEQVRILRGLGAIQPGVNRCKLLADTDFDCLYKDCTTSSSRPGRPPKRGVPFPPMSPQDAMLHLKQTMQHNGAAAAAAAAAAVAPGDPFKEHYGKEPRLDKHFGNGFGPHGPPGLNPMAAQFMALNHPAAFLSQAGVPPPFAGLPAAAAAAAVTSSPNLAAAAAAAASSRPDAPQQFMKNPGLTSLEALQRSGLFGAAYLERMREGQRNLQDQERAEQQSERRDRRDSSQDSLGKDERGSESPILNLTKPGGQNSSHLGSSGTRGPGSESPLSDAAAPNSSALAGATGATGRGGGRASSGGGIELSDDDDDDDLSDTNEKKEANNNKESSGVTATGGSDSATATGATPTSLAAMAGFPGLAALGSGAEATSGGNQLNSVYGLIGSIQALLKMAVENAKQEERQSMSQKPDAKTDLIKEKDSSSSAQSALERELEEVKKNTQVYFRRFRKEKRLRRRLEEQLEQERKRREQMEDALRAASADTLKRITESIQKAAEDNKKKENKDEEDAADEDQQQDQLQDQADSGDEGGSEFNAKVSSAKEAAAAAAVAAGGRGGGDHSPPPAAPPPTTTRDTPTIGFAKNLFPFNGSSLFTSAN